MRRHKYRAKPVTVDGIRFHSTAEAIRYEQLKRLAQAGAIRDLKLQPRYRLVVNDEHICDYIADFAYAEQGKAITEDVKGAVTDVYKLKRRLMQAIHGIAIREISAAAMYRAQKANR